MKKALSILLMSISSLLFSGCVGFSFTRVSEASYNKDETLWIRIHYTTADGQVIDIYEYIKPGVNPEDYKLNNEAIATMDNMRKNGIKTIFDLF